MSLPSRNAADPDMGRPAFDPGGDEDLNALLKPVMAGARARGVADGLELLGAGAVLIDATGRVLHVGARGRRLMAGRVRVVEDHLVADAAADNRAVENLVGGAISRAAAPAGIRLGGPGAGPALSIRALPFLSDEGPAQRLHAVLVLDEV